MALNKDIAYHTSVEFYVAQKRFTDIISPYFLSLSYTDNESDETDDLQISLADSEGIWLEKWITGLIDMASKTEQRDDVIVSGAKVEAIIIQHNAHGDGKDYILNCGEFELDSIKETGPPNTVTVKATSIPYKSTIRQTVKSRAWENYYLSGIANEIATAADMRCMIYSEKNPHYSRIEQYQESDISFLLRLCQNAGISLKVTNSIIVLFDQAEFEKTDIVRTILRGDGSYTKYTMSSGKANTAYASCRVSYVDPATGKCIQGVATESEENTSDDAQQLEITAKVSSVAEAQELAAQKLRMHNKYEKTANFTMIGDTRLVAGANVSLEGWGIYDGKYAIEQAKHSVGSSGYTTTIKLRLCLEG